MESAEDNCHNKLPLNKFLFECDVCEKTFVLKVNLEKHKQLHNEERFTCNICGKECDSNCQLEVHLRKHTGERPFSCEICQKSFISRSVLDSHCKSSFHQIREGKKIERSFKCDICKKSFFSKSDLSAHKRLHSGVKPYSCDTCDKPFSTKQDLKIHKRIHTGERPYSCETCVKSFISSSDLTKHNKSVSHLKAKNGEIIINDRVDIYECDKCAKRFSHETLLTIHKTTCTKLHSCNLCKEVFFTPNDLDSHKIIHKGDIGNLTLNRGGKNIIIQNFTEGKNILMKRISEGKNVLLKNVSGGKNILIENPGNMNIKLNERATSGGEIQEGSASITELIQFTCYTCGENFSKIADFNTHNLRHINDNSDKDLKVEDVKEEIKDVGCIAEDPLSLENENIYDLEYFESYDEIKN